jgi:hypothetical protein
VVLQGMLGDVENFLHRLASVCVITLSYIYNVLLILKINLSP